jgi:hypothetical protein
MLQPQLSIDSSNQIEHIGNNPSGWVIRYNIPIAISIPIARRRRRNVPVICLRHYLELIVVRNPLSSRKLQPTLRPLLPAMNIFAVIRLKVLPVPITKAIVTVMTAIAALLIITAITIVMIALMLVALMLVALMLVTLMLIIAAPMLIPVMAGVPLSHTNANQQNRNQRRPGEAINQSLYSHTGRSL